MTRKSNAFPLCRNSFSIEPVLRNHPVRSGKMMLHIHEAAVRIFECGRFLTQLLVMRIWGPPGRSLPVSLSPSLSFSRQRHRPQSWTTLSKWQFLPSRKMSENWLPIRCIRWFIKLMESGSKCLDWKSSWNEFATLLTYVRLLLDPKASNDIK